MLLHPFACVNSEDIKRGVVCGHCSCGAPVFSPTNNNFVVIPSCDCYIRAQVNQAMEEHGITIEMIEGGEENVDV